MEHVSLISHEGDVTSPFFSGPASCLLQTMTKTPAKFQKDWLKTVRGVASTNYPSHCALCLQTDRRMDVHTSGHLLGTTVLTFRLKISNKMPKYPTVASILLGSYFGHLQNKLQVANSSLHNICCYDPALLPSIICLGRLRIDSKYIFNL